jgi:hypothetical protein
MRLSSSQGIAMIHQTFENVNVIPSDSEISTYSQNL